MATTNCLPLILYLKKQCPAINESSEMPYNINSTF